MVAALVPFCLGALALAVLAWAPLPELDHAVAEATRELDGARPEVVVLGNSVAQASVDPAALGPDGTAVLAAISGGQPAHWLAVLAHRVHGAGLRPDTIVLYVPTHQFGTVVLDHPRDQALLISLVGMAGDDALFLAALGRAGPSLRQRLLKRRAPVRDALLRAVSYAPVQALYERPGGPPHVEAAMDTLFGGQAANEAGQRGSTGPVQDPGVEARERSSLPSSTPEVLEASLIPALIDEAGRYGGQLVVVVPAQRGLAHSCRVRPTTEPVISWLTARGVTVVDLEQAGLGGGAFESNHHASRQGRQEVSALVARGVAHTADSPGTTWRPGCD